MIYDFKGLEKKNSLAEAGIFGVTILFQITAPEYHMQEFTRFALMKECDSVRPVWYYDHAIPVDCE